MAGAPADATPLFADAIEALDALLSGLGFEPSHDDRGRFRLHGCPFHAAAGENPTLVCSLHHGIVEGFTATIDPAVRVSLFEPGNPARAGCLVGVSRS